MSSDLSIPKTHKEAVVDYDFISQIQETPVPTPSPDELLVKVIVAAANPKDHKCITFRYYGILPVNPGEDVAGIVVAVGSDVVGFKVGDRVSGLHRFKNPGGAFAEYALLPSNTTFHIPEKISFAEAVTLGTPAYTAGVALVSTLGLPAPWSHPPKEEIPLLIYGASTTVGFFAIQLAKAAGIGPIIAVAGASGDKVVKPLLSEKDLYFDYRSPTLVADIKAALGETKLNHVLEAAGVVEGNDVSIELVERGNKSKIASVQFRDYPLPEDIEFTYMTAASAHTPSPYRENFYPTPEHDAELGAVLGRWFERALAKGTLKPFWVREIGGLEKVGEGIKELKDGKVHGERIVFRVREE